MINIKYFSNTNLEHNWVREEARHSCTVYFDIIEATSCDNWAIINSNNIQSS